MEPECRSRSPRGRLLKGFTSRELRHTLAKQGGERQCGVFKPSGHQVGGSTLVVTTGFRSTGDFCGKS